MKYTPEQLETMEKAAPDMLEALEELIGAWNSSPEITHQIIKAIMVVSKAKGENQ